MRLLRLAVVLVILCYATTWIHAGEMPDMRRAVPLQRPIMCSMGPYYGKCFRLEMDSTEFIMIMDSPESVAVIYSVRPSSLDKPAYRIEDLVVIYERGAT